MSKPAHWTRSLTRMALTRMALTRMGLTMGLVLSAGFGIGLDSSALAKTTTKTKTTKAAAIVVDMATGKVIYEERADSQRYPASITKVMTLYKLFEALDDGKVTMATRFTVSARAAGQAPSKLGLRAGDTIRVADVIPALVIQSANDVAVVVAENLGGTESKFAKEMTETAREMGMSRTTFVNASGLPNSKQITTARDLSVLADRMIERFPHYYGYFSEQSFKWSGRTYKTHNHLVGRVDGVDGLKTGYINASGFNILTSAERDGRRIIAVVMGGATSAARDSRAKSLIDQKFAELERAGSPRVANLRLGKSKSRLAFADVSPRVKPALDDAQADEPEDGGPVADAVALLPAGLPEGQAEAIQTSFVSADDDEGAGAFLVSSARASTLGGSDDVRAAHGTKGGLWSIQIGAYVSTETANAQLRSAREVVPDLLSSAAEQVVQVKIDNTPFYRARFVAFNENQADRACAALAPHGFKCFKIPREEGTEFQTGLAQPISERSLTR